MQTLSYLTDVIGGRLTGSPNMKRANEWTRDTDGEMGNAKRASRSLGTVRTRLVAQKFFGAGHLRRKQFPVIAYPKAGRPSTKGAVTREVVFFDAKTEADFEKYKGKLKGKIVLISPIARIESRRQSLCRTRLTDEDLKKMAKRLRRSAATATAGD